MNQQALAALDPVAPMLWRLALTSICVSGIVLALCALRFAMIR